MKKVALLLGLLLMEIIAIGCSNDEPNCDEQLQQLYDERNRGFQLCGDSFPCSKKVQAEFDEKEKQVLENCN